MIRYFRPYQDNDLSAVPEQDWYAMISRNGIQYFDPRLFILSVIGGWIPTGGKSITGMLKKGIKYWDYNRTNG